MTRLCFVTTTLLTLGLFTSCRCGFSTFEDFDEELWWRALINYLDDPGVKQAKLWHKVIDMFDIDAKQFHPKGKGYSSWSEGCGKCFFWTDWDVILYMMSIEELIPIREDTVVPFPYDKYTLTEDAVALKYDRRNPGHLQKGPTEDTKWTYAVRVGGFIDINKTKCIFGCLAMNFPLKENVSSEVCTPKRIVQFSLLQDLEYDEISGMC